MGVACEVLAKLPEQTTFFVGMRNLDDNPDTVRTALPTP